MKIYLNSPNFSFFFSGMCCVVHQSDGGLFLKKRKHFSHLIYLNHWMPYILTSTANPSSPQSWVKMETESILSGHSEFNQRLVNGHRTTPRPLPPLKGEIFFVVFFSFSLSPQVFFFSIKLLTKLRFFFYFLVFS